ncbi:MAG: ABC transporter substrate-binding protein [Acidobacteriota bacterium]|jgi:peptide/nickel transport system substrate-binding protein
MRETTLFRRLRQARANVRPRPGVQNLGLALTLGLVLTLSWACGPAEETAPEAEGRAGETATRTPHRGGTVVIGTIGDIEGVNEAISAGTRTSDDVHFQMFLHLLDENPDFEDGPPSWGPELAESYTWSDDHLSLTFHLREDAVWSDGVPITAEDVRFTWLAHIDPDVAYGGAYLKKNIRDVEVVDPHTVTFRYKRVSPYQLNATVEGVILPKHAWGELPFDRWRSNADFFLDNLVVSGPFTLERWKPQEEVVLVRNESYFDPELPYLDRVVFRLIPDISNQVTQLLNGDLHVVEQVPITDVERIRSSSIARIAPFWHRLYAHVSWNMDQPMFSSASVRRALTMSIDRQLIVDTLWKEYARVATSPIISNAWAHNDAIEPWPYDPERARQIFADAGWTDSDGDGVLDRDGVPFAFDLITNQGNQARLDAVVMIQDQLARVGIEARPRVLEFNAMTSRLLNRNFEAAFNAFGMPTTLELRYAFHSSSIGGGWNTSGYSNPEVDRLIEQMESLPSLAEAEPILLRIQEVLHRDQPMTFMWESQRVNGQSRRLHDVQANLLSTYWYLREWWLEPPEE